MKILKDSYNHLTELNNRLRSRKLKQRHLRNLCKILNKIHVKIHFKRPVKVLYQQQKHYI